MKLGSVTGLQDFYQSRVINYSKNMEHTCQELMTEYEKLMQPVIQKSESTPDTVPVIRYNLLSEEERDLKSVKWTTANP